ncbi:unnamed protein product, partial [Laminaria digitata]
MTERSRDNNSDECAANPSLEMASVSRDEDTQVGHKRKQSPNPHEQYYEGSSDDDDFATALPAARSEGGSDAGRQEESPPAQYDQGPASAQAMQSIRDTISACKEDLGSGAKEGQVNDL